MRKISIKDVKDGMVLADPLENAHGSILVGAGTVLTEAFAVRLAQRGVSVLYIEGEPEIEGTEAARASVSYTKAGVAQSVTLEKIFENRVVNVAMKTIYEALIRRRAALSGS